MKEGEFRLSEQGKFLNQIPEFRGIILCIINNSAILYRDLSIHIEQNFFTY